MASAGEQAFNFQNTLLIIFRNSGIKSNPYAPPLVDNTRIDTNIFTPANIKENTRFYTFVLTVVLRVV